MRKGNREMAKTYLLAALGCVTAVALSACSSTSQDGSSSGNRVTNLIFLNKLDPGPAPAPQERRRDVYCPPVTVQPGTAALAVYTPGGQGDPMALRYQVSMGETARECTDLGAEVSIRVGVQGRVIAGPKGGGASTDVPVRVAVVDSKGTPVYSKLTRVRATLPAGQPNQVFTHVEEGITLPAPEGGLRGYRILVGFDNEGRGGR